MTPVHSLDAEQRAELEADENRSLTPEEFTARVNAPWSEQEREDFAALCRWFVRRYPTAMERLRATTHLARQWRAASTVSRDAP